MSITVIEEVVTVHYSGMKRVMISSPYGDIIVIGRIHDNPEDEHVWISFSEIPAFTGGTRGAPILKKYIKNIRPARKRKKR